MKKNIIKKHLLTQTQEASGDSLTSVVFELEGLKGPEVYIQSSMHGAELQGNGVIHHLLEFFEQNTLKGKMTLIPLVNPVASNAHNGGHTQGRFEFMSGENWNRLYTDILRKDELETKLNLRNFVGDNLEESEVEIRKKFKKKLKDALTHYKKFLAANPRGLDGLRTHHLDLQIKASSADIVLDLHTGPVATDYLYVADYMKERARDANFPFMLVIPSEFAGAMDEACFSPWVGLVQEFENHGRNISNHFDAFTVELGSEELLDLALAKTQTFRLLQYLAHKGVCEMSEVKKWGKGLSNPKEQYWCLLKDYRRYYSPSGGLIHYKKKPAEFFEAGETLFEILNFKEKKHLTEINARYDGIVIYHHTSSSVREGTNIMQVMENYYKF